jgi:hypothetical protein
LALFAYGDAQYTLVTRPGALPGGTAVAWLSAWVWVLGLTPMVTFGLLLFPDGRLPSARWRPLAWLAAAAVALPALANALMPGRLPLASTGAPDRWQRWLLRRSLRTEGVGLLRVGRPRRPAADRAGAGGQGALAGGGGACRPASSSAAWTSIRSAAGAPGTGGVTLAMLAYASWWWPRSPSTPATHHH